MDTHRPGQSIPSLIIVSMVSVGVQRLRPKWWLKFDCPKVDFARAIANKGSVISEMRLSLDAGDPPCGLTVLVLGVWINEDCIPVLICMLNHRTILSLPRHYIPSQAPEQ